MIQHWLNLIELERFCSITLEKCAENLVDHIMKVNINRLNDRLHNEIEKSIGTQKNRQGHFYKIFEISEKHKI